jgi:hypothetical protein
MYEEAPGFRLDPVETNVKSLSVGAARRLLATDIRLRQAVN